MIVLNDGQLVHVAACIAAGYASSKAGDPVKRFYKTLEMLEEINEQNRATLPDGKINAY